MSIQKNNLLIAEQLRLLADLETLDGNPWPANAYKKAAEIVRSLDVPIDTIGDLKSFGGIGESISKKIIEILKTGTCKKLESLKVQYKSALEARKLLVVPGVGMKTAIKLYNDGITTVQELSDACDAGKVTAKSIKQGVKLALKTQGRIPIYDVLPVVESILDDLRSMDGVHRISFAGSVRRGRETVKDVDILIVANDPDAIFDRFLQYGEELIRGDQKARIIAPINDRTSIQVDLLFTTKQSWPFALAYFTGSKEHNIAIRRLALDKGYSLNEHGFSDKITGLRHSVSDGILFEEQIYDFLGIPWCPPELREGSDLLEEIPDLVTLDDIQADWHTHTTYSSDARNSVYEMAASAKNHGLKILGITDHVEVQYRWMPEDIDKRVKEARQAEEILGIKIYTGAEVGVNNDGSLEDRIDLDKQDYLIASIHKSHDKHPVKRLLVAIEDPRIKMIGHPTGRIIGRRDIPDEDWEVLFKRCAELGVLVEINSPRLDLPVAYIKMAKKCGCKFVINSDSHAVEHFIWLRYGVSLARRAGLTKFDLATPLEIDRT